MEYLTIGLLFATFAFEWFLANTDLIKENSTLDVIGKLVMKVIRALLPIIQDKVDRKEPPVEPKA
jgi:hypothetical protein